MKKLLYSLLLVALILPSYVLGTVGVGVATGKIQIEDKLKPGVIYQLPPFTVINTGDEAGDYEVAITYFNGQKELSPPQNWFIFSPQKFYLEPKQNQVINVKLNLPLKMQPGNYFCFLEGHPIMKTKKGESTIGVAAASRLYFSVIPANFIQGIYYKIISFYKVYAPWPQRVSLLVCLILALGLFKKFFNIQIGLRKTKSDKTD